MIYNIAIIGAGAAGLFAGANAAPLKDVIILEKNPLPGKKLLLTGAGQCNLTHGGPIQDFLTHYGGQGKALRSVLFPYSNQAVMEFFRKQGVPLIQRDDGKVFPASLKSRDILDALRRSCEKAGVTFRFSAGVTSLFPCEEDGLWHIEIQNDQVHTEEGFGKRQLIGGQNSDETFCQRRKSGETVKARRVIAATGGLALPVTGSDGSLLSVLEKLEIPMVPPRPALTPVYVQDYPFASLSGISLPDTRLAIKKAKPQLSKAEQAQLPALTDKQDRKETPAITGSTLLTHTGFSGPAILSLSRYVKTGDTLAVSWIPPSMEDSLSNTLRSPSPEEGNRQLSTVLCNFTPLPRRFLELLCHRANVMQGEKLCQLSGSKRKALLSCLFRDTYSVSGLGGFSAAMVSAGGVALDSVHLKTMESRLHPGLYFAGEILDVDGDTGGYNLQFAFSSGFAAIRSAARSLAPQ